MRAHFPQPRRGAAPLDSYVAKPDTVPTTGAGPHHTNKCADEQIRQAAPPVQRSGVCTDRVTGAKHVQQFRRTYFTAEWTDSVLVEVRVWGPRVLQDGSLGERELDYRSKNARATRGRSIRS